MTPRAQAIKLIGTADHHAAAAVGIHGGRELRPHASRRDRRRARYWLYRQYKKQHTDIVGIFLVRELDTVKNYNDSWQVSGGVRVHDPPAPRRTSS